MSIGIYSIFCGEEKKFYIGQSVNIEERKRAHKCLLLANKHYNYKLQNAFNKTKIFLFSILEECNVETLYKLEEKYMNKTSSLKIGYNLCSAGISGRGLDHPSIKYSREQILEVFFLSLNIHNSYLTISNLTGINISSVRNIAERQVHAWLDELFPEESALLKSIVKDRLRISAIRRSKNHKFNKLKSPEGIVYDKIYNISEFSRQHKLNKNLIGQVLLGNRNHHKGWVGIND